MNTSKFSRRNLLGSCAAIMGASILPTKSKAAELIPSV